MTVLGRSPQNSNYLQPTKFLLSFPDIMNTQYFCQQVITPKLFIPYASQPALFRNIPHAGETIQYETFSVEFIVNEDLLSYLVIFDWMQGYSFPENFEQYKNVNRRSIISLYSSTPVYSDVNLSVLTNLNNITNRFHFTNCFPISLSPLIFDSKLSAENIMTATAEFKFDSFCIEKF